MAYRIENYFGTSIKFDAKSHPPAWMITTYPGAYGATALNNGAGGRIIEISGVFRSNRRNFFDGLQDIKVRYIRPLLRLCEHKLDWSYDNRLYKECVLTGFVPAAPIKVAAGVMLKFTAELTQLNYSPLEDL